MNGLGVIRRLRAYDKGIPIPRGATKHIHVAGDDDLLVLAFLRMGGESRPWAIAFGPPDKDPTLLTVPEGRNRDLVADMCADFAPVLLDHLRTPNYSVDEPAEWEDLAPLRQIWVPNGTHLDMLHHLAYAYTFTKWGAGKRGRLNAFGRACGWLFREATRPGQQTVAVATEALRSAYTFPAQDIRQGHLGFLLAWLAADGDRDDRFNAALAAEELAVSTTLDPDVERASTERLVGRWGEARRAEDERRMKRAAAELERVLGAEVLRRWELTRDAIEVLRSDTRRPNTGLVALTNESLREQWFQHTRLELSQHDPEDGYAFFPSPETDRYPAAAASRYLVHQASDDQAISVLLHDDAELIAEAIGSGDAFAGGITAVVDVSPGRATTPIWTIRSDSQGVLRLREGSWVSLVGTPQRWGVILDIEDQPDGARLFQVEIRGWKTIPKTAPPGLLHAADGALVGSLVAMVKSSGEEINRRRSRMVWKADVPGGWLTHARPMGPRAVLDPDVAEDLAAISPIAGQA